MEAVARSFLPRLRGPVRHQAPLGWVPTCSPSVRCVCGQQGHMAVEGTWAGAKLEERGSRRSPECKRADSFVSGTMYFLNFFGLAVAPPSLGSDLSSRLD